MLNLPANMSGFTLNSLLIGENFAIDVEFRGSRSWMREIREDIRQWFSKYALKRTFSSYRKALAVQLK